jgi:hypothetical protein
MPSVGWPPVGKLGAVLIEVTEIAPSGQINLPSAS